MIRTVTVYTGESDFAKAAQEHAIAMARQFSARLKVVRIWNAKDEDMPADGTGPVSTLEKNNQQEIVAAAERAGVQVATGSRGKGMTRSLLEESLETDLLVLGLPTNTEQDATAVASHLLSTERPVLKDAHCALLVVNRAPTPVRKVLARYESGSAGKAMLRMSAAIAERYRAHLGLLIIENDQATSTPLAAAAEEYLQGFDLPKVETICLQGAPDSREMILDTAASFGADLITMGEEGHNWLDYVLGENLVERIALLTSIPLLIVR